jgi:hypothetical protein
LLQRRPHPPGERDKRKAPCDDYQEYFIDYYILLLIINDYYQLLQGNPHPLGERDKRKAPDLIG